MERLNQFRNTAYTRQFLPTLFARGQMGFNDLLFLRTELATIAKREHPFYVSTLHFTDPLSDLS